jgi:phosphate transport system substrate-binding protein
MRNLLLILVAVSIGTIAVRADTLVIKGSDTLGAKLVPQLAEEFKAQHAGTTFNIAAEGSTTGIAAIIDGTAQIGMASRPTKPEEVAAAKAKGVTFKETIVAYDGIAVIVNSANPVKTLTKKQVEQIFTGDSTDWSAVGGSAGKISIYTRNTSSGTYSEFKRTRDEEARLCARLAEDGGQRTNRGGSEQKSERRRLRWTGLHESERN